MPLKRHGRYDYSALPKRPVYDWPHGRRLAVYLALNLETFSFGEGLGAALTPKAEEPDVLNYAWRDWGNRVGAWRLLGLFEDEGWPVSALVNSELCDEAPDLVAAFSARGDEIVAHGRTNAERQGALSRSRRARADPRGDATHRRDRGPRAARLARTVDFGKRFDARPARRSRLRLSARLDDG